MEFVLENGEKIVFTPKAKVGGGANKFAALRAKMDTLEVGKAFIATEDMGLTTEKRAEWDDQHLIKLNTGKITWQVNAYVKVLNKDLAEGAAAKAYKCAEKDGVIYVGRTA